MGIKEQRVSADTVPGHQLQGMFVERGEPEEKGCIECPLCITS